MIRLVCKTAKRSAHLSETHAAFLAFGLHLLSRVALRADQFGQCFAVEMVFLVLVVTVSTLVEFPAAWRLLFCGGLLSKSRAHYIVKI